MVTWSSGGVRVSRARKSGHGSASRQWHGCQSPAQYQCGFRSCYSRGRPAHRRFLELSRTINIVYPGGPTLLNSLQLAPLHLAHTTSKDAIVAAGHGFQPVLFSGGPSGWQAAGSLDDTTAPKLPVSVRGGSGYHVSCEYERCGPEVCDMICECCQWTGDEVQGNKIQS